MALWQETDIWWENFYGNDSDRHLGNRENCGEFIEVWILSSTSGWKDEVRQGKRQGSWQFTVGMSISWEFNHRKDLIWYSQLTILGGTSENYWKLTGFCRSRKTFVVGWIQVFPPIPTFARNDWRCFTEAYSDSDLSAGCLPKQLECCFSNVFVALFCTFLGFKTDESIGV